MRKTRNWISFLAISILSVLTAITFTAKTEAYAKDESIFASYLVGSDATAPESSRTKINGGKFTITFTAEKLKEYSGDVTIFFNTADYPNIADYSYQITRDGNPDTVESFEGSLAATNALNFVAFESPADLNPDTLKKTPVVTTLTIFDQNDDELTALTINMTVGTSKAGQALIIGLGIGLGIIVLAVVGYLIYAKMNNLFPFYGNSAKKARLPDYAVHSFTVSSSKSGNDDKKGKKTEK